MDHCKPGRLAVDIQKAQVGVWSRSQPMHVTGLVTGGTSFVAAFEILCVLGVLLGVLEVSF